MRKLLIIPLMCLLTIAIHAQTTKNIHLSYSANEFTFADNDGITTISSPQHLLLFESDTLAPALPYILVNVYLSENTEYTGFTYSKTESVVRTNVTLPANQIECATSTDPLPVVPVSTGYPSGTYPDIRIENTGVHKSGKYKFASFKVFPFKYDTATQQLYLATSIDLTISLDSIAEPVQSGGNFMGKSIKRIVVNAEEVPYYEDSLDTSPQLHVIDGAEYLIITNTNLAPEFQRLANWKTMKGIRTKVLTTEYINEAYPGSTLQLKIKTAISHYYNGESYQLKYVLLGGDVDVVPTQKCFASIVVLQNGNNVQKNDEIPTDIFYGCLDNMSWDMNQDGLSGDINDDVDMAPEVIVSRLPISTIEDAGTIVERIIDYEINPLSKEWNKKILLAGKELVTDSDGYFEGVRLYEDYIRPYWDGNTTLLFDCYTSFEEGSNYDFTASHLQTELEKGYILSDITTHGNVNIFDMEYGSPYSLYEASSLNNIGYSVVTTVACSTNAFDSSNVCLSEALLRNPNSGIIAYLGSSRTGLSRYSHIYNQEFYYHLFCSQGKQIGRAFFDMKNSLVGACHPNMEGSSYMRWLYYGLNLIGDPEMSLYVNSPESFNNVQITYNQHELIVDAGTNNCTICVMSIDDVGHSYYNIKKSVECDSFLNVNNNVAICITKVGYKPYIAIISNQHIIQNTDIKHDLNIIADDVIIGSDITDEKEYGPVTISNGLTKIKGHDGVTIKNDFEVKAGAEFEITTE